MSASKTSWGCALNSTVCLMVFICIIDYTLKAADSGRAGESRARAAGTLLPAAVASRHAGSIPGPKLELVGPHGNVARTISLPRTQRFSDFRHGETPVSPTPFPFPAAQNIKPPVKDGCMFLSGRRESNPVFTHPKRTYYRYTTARELLNIILFLYFFLNTRFKFVFLLLC